MPALEFPAQIRLPAIQATQTSYFQRPTLANSQVLELLLPQLVVPRAKQARVLTNVDDYMLQETRELYVRIGDLCQRLNIHNSLKIQLDTHTGQIEVIGDTQYARHLQQLIQVDPWLPGAFAWLHPNYLMLAQSQELLAFSKAYQQSTTLALAKYHHLALPENGMTCCLRLAEGEIDLVVESALHIYQVSTK
jgi:hypothetical protein